MRKLLKIMPALALLVAGALGGDWLHRLQAGASLPDVTDVAPAAIGPVTAWAFPNQFFVPIVRNGNLRAMMVLGLGVEVIEGREDAVTARELHLRDALLRALMIHANTGGFDGNFTSEPHLRRLGEVLLTAAQGVAGEDVRAILIGDIARQAQ